jgi:hypothetical protein
VLSKDDEEPEMLNRKLMFIPDQRGSNKDNEWIFERSSEAVYLESCFNRKFNTISYGEKSLGKQKILKSSEEKHQTMSEKSQNYRANEWNHDNKANQ